MANHIDFGIHFYKINDKAKATLQELLDNVEKNKQSDGEGDFSDLLLATEENKEDWDWRINNVGAKWCHLTEWDGGDSPMIHGYSAWSAPQDGVQTLMNILVKDDPDLIVGMEYTDEMPNFKGWMVWDGNTMQEMEEMEYPELVEMVIREETALEDGDYDFEEGEWVSQEKEDIFEESKWEYWDDYFWTGMNEEMSEVERWRDAK